VERNRTTKLHDRRPLGIDLKQTKNKLSRYWILRLIAPHARSHNTLAYGKLEKFSTQKPAQQASHALAA
jgi:hypothetical protein